MMNHWVIFGCVLLCCQSTVFSSENSDNCGAVSTVMDNPLFKEQVDFRKQALENIKPIDDVLRQALVAKPKARLIAVGEQHGRPNDHLALIATLKTLRKDFNVLFLEISDINNSVLDRFYNDKLSVDEAMLTFDYQVKSHITRELLLATRLLEIRIVGVEKLRGAAGFASMLNLKSRNAYTAEKITTHLNHKSSENQWQKKLEEENGLFEVGIGMYIGGAGHLEYRNSELQSVTDRMPVNEVVKVCNLYNGSHKWSLDYLNVPSEVVPEITKLGAFTATSDRNLMLQPQLPIVNTDLVSWDEYDFYIALP